MFKLLRDLLTFVMAVVESLLIVRFLLKLLNANPRAEIVDWIYNTTQPLLQPFLFAFPTPSIKGGFVLEFTTLFALFAYAFVGYLFEVVIEMLSEHLDKKKG